MLGVIVPSVVHWVHLLLMLLLVTHVLLLLMMMHRLLMIVGPVLLLLLLVVLARLWLLHPRSSRHGRHGCYCLWW